MLSFLRYAKDGSALACVGNFAGTPHDGLPDRPAAGGRWREVLNTDAEAYGGTGVGNFGAVEAAEDRWHGQPASALLRLPPLGTVWLAADPPK